MACERRSSARDAAPLKGCFRRDLKARRRLQLELPEFLICALEARVAEANLGTPLSEQSTLDDYIESELVNLVSLRDIAELEFHHPGFAAAVNHWLDEMG